MTEAETEADAAPVETDAADAAYVLDARMVGQIVAAAEIGALDRLARLLAPMHPADIADLLEQIPAAERERLLRLWPTGFDGNVLSELDDGLREDVLAFVPQELLARTVRHLESDDLVDLVENLPDGQQSKILGLLDNPARIAVEQALRYPEYTAGRLMQRETVALPADWTVGEAIDHLRAATRLPGQFYHVMLVDPLHRVRGQVNIGRLMGSERGVRLDAIEDENFHPIPVTQSEEDVAYAFNQYHMVTAPVVNPEGRLLGVITIDDAMIVQAEEAEEDFLRLGGAGESRPSDGVWETVRGRFPWLAVNLCATGLSALAISQFADAIDRIVALAVLMPIVASMGGSAGTQSLTVAVRGLATKDLTASNALRVVGREVMAGLINGVVFALVIGTLGELLFNVPWLGVVLAAATVWNMVVAALAGVLVPLGLEKAGIDPALASGTFVMTMTDVMGFVAFLGLATLVLL
jgi:magnesium transporter